MVLKHFSEVTHNLVGDFFEHELHHTQDIHFLKADGMCVYYYSKVQKVSRLSEVFIVYNNMWSRRSVIERCCSSALVLWALKTRQS